MSSILHTLPEVNAKMQEGEHLPVGGLPFAETKAAHMLRSGLDQVKKEHGLSLRAIGRQLGYKQPTVLSHMASGRVQVPIERAADIARAVGLPPQALLAAAVAQRTPEAADLLMQIGADAGMSSYGLLSELSLIAERPLDELNEEQKAVLREVVRDPSPSRRWLAIAEMPAVSLLRQRRPKFRSEGLSATDSAALDAALA